MIINKNSTNNVVVTATEKQTTVGPDWLIEFKHDMTEAISVLSVVDISLYPERYNEFVIIEPTDIELIAGTYSYRVLEMTQSSPPDNVTANALAVCEEDICMVIGTPATNGDFDTTTQTNGTFDL